jgi:peptide/nickel transport system permease protein
MTRANRWRRIARLGGSRLASSLVAIFGASLISFILLRVIPGNPARLILGQFASQDQVNALVAKMGLNQPIFVQYFRYIKAFVQGDWGTSYSSGVAVTQEFGQRFPATIELGLYAFLFAVVGAFVLASFGVYRRRVVADRAVVGLSYLGLGVPPFWVAFVLLLIFYQKLKWFPGPEGRLSITTTPPPAITHLYTVDALIAGQWHVFVDAVWHLFLPTVALGVLSLSFLMRLLRAGLLDVSREPFLVVVRSKGVGRLATFRRHTLPNALLPTLTFAGIMLGQLLAGSVLVEKVFAWPGIGALVVDAILKKEYAIVQAFVLLSAIIYVVINFFVDMLYGVVDPRVREQ